MGRVRIEIDPDIIVRIEGCIQMERALSFLSGHRMDLGRNRTMRAAVVAYHKSLRRKLMMAGIEEDRIDDLANRIKRRRRSKRRVRCYDTDGPPSM